MSDEKNTKPLSMRRIKALKALCKKATPAPWEDKREPSLTEDGEELRRYYHIESKKGTICELFYNEDWEAMGCYDNDAVDAAFIAAARQAVPDLLAEVERLRVENQRLEKSIDWLVSKRFPCPRDGSQCYKEIAIRNDTTYAENVCEQHWRDAALRAAMKEEEVGNHE